MCVRGGPATFGVEPMSFGNKVCVATLITPRWALTAAHCTSQTPLAETLSSGQTFPVDVAGQIYLVEKLELHPRYNTGNELTDVDLALLQLDRDVSRAEPAGLYRQTDEVNRVYTLLGWGFTGIGTREAKHNDGRFRRAQNRVVAAGQWLEFVFDDPRNLNADVLDLEGVPGLGDSRGPALLETEDSLVVAGIALGELESGDEPSVQGMYGGVHLYERVSSHVDWIDGVTSDE